MLFDLQKDRAVLSQKVYDVCICGSGPAGITVARELAAAGKKVVLLEAGGFDYSEESQANYAGTESGISTYNTSVSSDRLRYFGGTSNHWTGMCGVFDESDFWPERYHDLPGWPIARREILKFLPEAASILDLNTTDLASQPFGNPPWQTFEQRVTTMSPPTRFGIKYREEIVQSKNIDLFIHANVVDLHLAAQGVKLNHIDSLLVCNYQKQYAKVVAKRYILALGSIENARLLLNANKQSPQGVGNQSDFVGRCYMEHFNVQMGRFVTRNGAHLPAHGVGLSPTDSTLRDLDIGNGILSLSTSGEPTEYGRLAPIRKILRNAACQTDTVREFARKFKDFTCTGDGIISTMLEQAPDRRNRISLGTESDQFGLKRPHIHWELSDADRRTIRSLGFELAKNFVKYDLGRVQLNGFMTDPTKEIEVWPHAHQMGTTRMSADPNAGVVNSNCRMHEVNNLYIAGSSVFPTGGGINPTLTIVMLSIRLARHLQSQS